MEKKKLIQIILLILLVLTTFLIFNVYYKSDKTFESSKGSGFGMSYSLTYSYHKGCLVNFGKVTKDLCEKFGVKSDVYMADFNWDLVLELARLNTVRYQEVRKFPEVRRDLSLLIDDSVSFDQLLNIAKQTNNKILQSVNLFDVYEGDNLPKGKKSYALSFIMADKNKTLTDKHVDQVMDILMNSFKKKVGAEIR